MLAARPGSTETTVRAIVPRALTPVEGGACIQHFSWRLMWWLFAGFVWTHDPVVHNPSARRWTTPSIQAIMEAIVWYTSFRWRVPQHAGTCAQNVHSYVADASLQPGPVDCRRQGARRLALRGADKDAPLCAETQP